MVKKLLGDHETMENRDDSTVVALHYTTDATPGTWIVCASLIRSHG
jgi:hypothetical protein